MIASIQNFLDNIIWGDQLRKAGLPGRVLETILRYLYAMLRDFFSGQLTMRAMSLVYTTLLSVIPLLAVSFAILKGFGVFNQLEPYLDNLLAPLGEQGEQITAQILGLVNNVQGSVLGGVGLAFFLYTAISTVQKIEESFNYVWYVSKPRNFGRRFTEYLIVLIVGPMVMVTAIGMITSIQNNAVMQYLLNNAALGPVFVLAGKFVPYLLISGVFTFLYVYMPNTKVRLKSALVGGVAGGFMWATMAAIFTTFIVYATRTQQIYAGFAVVITTLILAVPELANSPDRCSAGFLPPASGISTHRPPGAEVIERNARTTGAERHVPGRSDVSQFGQDDYVAASQRETPYPLDCARTDLGGTRISRAVDVNRERSAVARREMSRITLTDILDVVRVQGETGSYRKPKWSGSIDALGDKLDSAVSGVIGERTLADFLDETEASKK